jgi:glycerol-3-phosphate acyltransferase PlsY
MTAAFAIILLAYLIGSFPTGFLVGKARGVDIRRHGSGNIGATNAFRILGPWLGGLVFLVDAAKGFFAVWAAASLNAHFPSSLTDLEGLYMPSTVVLPSVIAAILGAIWSMIGHSFTVWLGFKGGKGVATSLGTLFALVPWAGVSGLAIWIVLLFVTRYVSVASLAAAASVPVVTALTAPAADRVPLIGLTILLTAIIFWRHRANIVRLRRGTEHRWGRKKEE